MKSYLTKKNILFWSKNLIATILFVLYVAYFTIVQFNTVLNFVILLSLVVIFITGIIAFAKKIKLINYNDELNVLKIVVYFIISLLLYRTMFDHNMLYSYVNTLDLSSTSLFYRSNELYVSIISVGLLVYNLIFIKEENIKLIK